MNKVKISQIANITMGQSPLGKYCGENIKGLPLLNGPAEFTNFHPEPIQYTCDPKKRSTKGDILFCVRGSTTGRMNWSDQDYAIGRGLAAISHKKGYPYNHFLRYLLENYLASLLNNTNGSTFPNLTGELLAKFIVSVPTDEEQKRLSYLLRTIDSKIEFNNRINTNLEAIAKTLYDYWFLQFDFPDANGKPYKTSGGKMVYNPMLKQKIPETWTNGTLDSLGRIVGGSTPSTKNPENFTTNGIPWITPKDLSDNQGNKFITRGAQDISHAGMIDACLKKYPAGTVLLSSRAPIGYMAIARNELTTNQGFKSFIPINEFSSTFIYYTVKNSLNTITQYASGSTFKEISGSVLKTVKIPLPPSSTVNTFTKTIESSIEHQDLLEKENQLLKQLRDWLLPMLMNGQISLK